MDICDLFAALLDPYVDGELSEQDAARVRAHLEVCGACRSYVDDAQTLRAAFPTLEDTAVPDGFADGVMAVVRSGSVPQRRQKGRWLQAALPLAACLAIVVAVRLPLAQNAADSIPAVTAAGGLDAAPSVPEDRAVFKLDESETGDACVAEAGAPALYNAGAAADPAPICHRWVSLPVEQVGDALADFSGTAETDALTGAPITRYELSEADFDAVVAQLDAADLVTVDDGADSGLCVIWVTE